MRSPRAVIAAAAIAVGGALTVVAPAASAGPAAFSGFDTAIDGTGHCLHGSVVNCNDYDAKQYVWLNAGPATANLSDGQYFFAVLAPGGQNNPNDGAPKLLSSDAYTNRSFTITNGISSYAGTHDTDGNNTAALKIRVIPYADTPNGGGVYVLAICHLDAGGLQPAQKDCKFDAYKVAKSSNPGGGGFSAPSADKTATATHTHHVVWSITKTAAAPTTIYSGSPVNEGYTVTATKTVSNEAWGVTGTITVTNTNATPLTVTGVAEDLPADYPALGATCSVTPPVGGFPDTVPAAAGLTPGQSSYDYSCTPTVAPDYTLSYANRATVTYLDDQSQSQTVDAAAVFQFPHTATLDAGSEPESVTVTDTYIGLNSPSPTAGSGTTISDSTTFNYSRTLFNNLCVDYPNTASILDGLTVLHHADAKVTFCGPNAGGLTQGWWQNKNGQALLVNNIGSACTTLNSYVGAPTLADLVSVDGLYVPGDCQNSTKPSYLPKFDLNVFSKATSSGDGTKMLLSQWLTTLLDTASYITGKAGGPALTGGAHIYNPTGLLGLPQCTTIHDLLAAAVSQFGTYKTTKATVTALSSMFDRINNNLQPSCV